MASTVTGWRSAPLVETRQSVRGGMFDDLIPAQRTGMFDDLVPTQATAGAFNVFDQFDDPPGVVSNVFDQFDDAESESSSIAGAGGPSLAGRALGAAGWAADKAARAVGTFMPGVAAINAGRDYVNSLPEDERKDFVKGVIRSSAKGATLGGYDRVGALMHSAFSYKTYDEELARIRGDQAAFEDEHPVVAQGAELIGGAVTPGGVALKAAKKTGDLARWGLRMRGASPTVAKHGGRVAGGMAAGAGFGAVAGAGHTDDLTDVPQVASDMGTGAVVGAALGPAMEYGGGLVWNGTKWIGNQARDVGGRIGERFGMDASDAATRILADEVAGKDMARMPWQRPWAARGRVADLDAQVADAHAGGVRDSLALANDRVAGLTAHVAQNKWMPNQPYQDFFNENLGRQQERVSAGVGEALQGRPVNHRDFMRGLDDAATRDHDAIYADIRQGVLGGTPGDVHVVGLHGLIDESPALYGFVEQAAQDAVDDAAVRFTRADFNALVTGNGNLQTNALPPAIAERLYARLSEAAHAAGTAGANTRNLLERYQAALNRTARGRELLAVKERHSDSFANRDAAEAGEQIWNKQGAARRAELTTNERRDVVPQAMFAEGAAGGAVQKVVGDQGTFTRPRSLVGSGENRETITELFGNGAADRVEDLVRREGNVHDVSQRMLDARTAGNAEKPDPGILANAAKTWVQWRFTPSVATMNAWQRIGTGITKQRAAAMADIALNQREAGIARVRAELARREAVEARQPETARQIGARLQALSNQLGAYGDDYDPYAF